MYVNVGDIRDWVLTLAQENPLEDDMATHSSILAWRVPWTEEPGGLQPTWGHKELATTKRLAHFTHCLGFAVYYFISVSI